MRQLLVAFFPVGLMPRSARSHLPTSLPLLLARRLWLRAQRLDEPVPFGSGPDATRRAVEHLGYVQIDTINVIERCHHHILFTRNPSYRRADLQHAQSVDKSVFEYWAHALAYIPTRDLPFYMNAMRAYRTAQRGPWFANVTEADLRKVIRLISKDGPQTIRDIDDDVLVEKDHAWASRKPSKRALQLAFFQGDVTVTARTGMLKSYDLLPRHFAWETKPKPATERQISDYVIDRALRAQSVVSLDSICHLAAKRKVAVRTLLDARARRGELLAVDISGVVHWVAPSALEREVPESDLVHILSPFDPLVIQRKRLALFFGYEHLFEAYVPKEKRVFGYFTLPVLIGDRIAAAIDLKADRQAKSLLIQNWTWTRDGVAKTDKRRIEEALDRFAAFQFAS